MTRPGANVAGAVYGQILVTAVVASLSEEQAISAAEMYTGEGVTMFVFALAHVYADAVVERLRRDTGLRWPELKAVAAHEWPMAQAALPTLAILALGWLGVLSRDNAVDWAIVAGVVALCGWGFVIARRSRMSVLGTVGSVALNGALGMTIVALEASLH